ncbi:MAG: hypothetical protein WBM86_08880 [Waterburya sp.]
MKGNNNSSHRLISGYAEPNHRFFGVLLERAMKGCLNLTKHYAVRVSENRCLSFGPNNTGIYDNLVHEYEEISWSERFGYDGGYHSTDGYYKKDDKRTIEKRIIAIENGALSDWNYSVAYVNCEHIARFIIGGDPTSYQVPFDTPTSKRTCWDLAETINNKITELGL